jgi:hypothetical protein
VEKYDSKVTRKGFYTGLFGGRPIGGFLGLQLSQKVFSNAELIDPYQMELGQFGPEEGAIYAAVVGGYVAGGIGATKAVEKYQEVRDKKKEYTSPIEELENVREFLEDLNSEDLSEEILEENE